VQHTVVTSRSCSPLGGAVATCKQVSRALHCVPHALQATTRIQDGFGGAPLSCTVLEVDLSLQPPCTSRLTLTWLSDVRTAVTVNVGCADNTLLDMDTARRGGT
jgi:hypothetical protein